MKNIDTPHVITLPGFTLPEPAPRLLQIFERAGFEGSMVYGGFIRDNLAQKPPRDLDTLAFLQTDQIMIAPEDLADEVCDRLWTASDDIGRIHIARTTYDADTDNNFVRLRFKFNDIAVDMQVIEGRTDMQAAFNAQILGADAPINGFAATLDSGLCCDSRAPAQLNQRIYQPSPARSAREIGSRFANLAKRYIGLTRAEPDYDWEPPQRVIPSYGY